MKIKRSRRENINIKILNYISENWNIDFPSENTIVYQVKPSPSFTNDGIYYEVQESKSKKLPITLSNKKNNVNTIIFTLLFFLGVLP